MSACSAVQSTSARAASLKALIVISVRRTSGWTMIGSAGLSGLFAPVSARPWQAVLGVGGGVLVGDLRLRRGPGCRRRGAPRSSSRTWR